MYLLPSPRRILPRIVIEPADHLQSLHGVAFSQNLNETTISSKHGSLEQNRECYSPKVYIFFTASHLELSLSLLKCILLREEFNKTEG